MGRAFNVSIPAGGVGVDPVPISVSGETFFSGQIRMEVAYDPADFDSKQFAMIAPNISNVPTMRFAPNTILWIRQDPTAGEPEAVLFVLTQIGEGDY